MSTKLTEHGTYWVVETLASPGSRRHIPRAAVQVPKGDKAALKAEMVRQAEQARRDLGVQQTPEEPVV